jgi:hypothetical protein
MEPVKAVVLRPTGRYEWGCKESEGHMEDIAYIGIAIAFFGVAAAYVRGLDRIVSSRDGEEEQPVSGE